ncbi:unnamed protein product [Dibothriocephalus latus]|uniref:Uncharacterized protein n=1 Tax=Dibothriocephalus latus TaxID=60516 RepID=A0A3P6TJZ3_DIBLA|nr:unnamed protein product [Dibothriocephalus latus]
MRPTHANRLGSTGVWDRTLPKTPAKHVRYDPRPPPRYWDRPWGEEVDTMDQIKHARSSSDQSALQQFVRYSDTSLTDYTSPASSVHLREGWPEDVGSDSPFMQPDASRQSLQQDRYFIALNWLYIYPAI